MSAITAIALWCIIGSSFHASNLPQLHLHLSQLTKLTLKIVCFLGQLQQLFLLNAIYLLETLDLSSLIPQGIAGIGRVPKGSYQQQGSCHNRSNTTFHPFGWQVNAASILSIIGADADGIFLCYFFLFFVFLITQVNSSKLKMHLIALKIFQSILPHLVILCKTHYHLFSSINLKKN